MTRSTRFRTVLMALALAMPMALSLTTTLVADEKSRLTEEVQEATAALIKRDDSLAGEIAKAAGYAVFPGIGKGGLGVGAAYGSGQVVVNGTPVARTKLTQVTIGFQLGGQKYVEMILFENQKTLDRFLEGKFTFAAQASAVAVSSGASANAKYSDGVKVITMTIGGLMYEASLGGQKFGIEKY